MHCFKFFPQFHFFAGYFNKNSKTTNQSYLRNNAQHVITSTNRKVIMNGSMVFSKIGCKISRKTNQSPGKFEFMNLPHRIIFLQAGLGISHPSACMDIK